VPPHKHAENESKLRLGIGEGGEPVLDLLDDAVVVRLDLLVGRLGVLLAENEMERKLKG